MPDNLSEFMRRRLQAIEPELRRLAEVERLNAEDIGPRLKISPPSVHKYAKALGVNLVRKAHPKRNYDKAEWLPVIRKLRAAGKTWPEVAAVLGTTRITANRAGLAAGLVTINPRRSSTGNIY